MLKAFFVYLQMAVAIIIYRMALLLVLGLPLPFVYALYMYMQDSSFETMFYVILSLLGTPLLSIVANILVNASLRLDPFKQHESQPPRK